MFLTPMQDTHSGQSQHDCSLIQRCDVVKTEIVFLGIIKDLLLVTEGSIGVIVGDTVRLCLDYLVYFLSLIFTNKNQKKKVNHIEDLLQ